MQNHAARLTGLPEWKALEQYWEQNRTRHLRDWFDKEADRAARMSLEEGGLFLDYSKNRLDDEGFRRLFALAEAVNLPNAIEAMFSGEAINRTESRAVLHTALRAPLGQKIKVEGEDVVPEVHAVLERMSGFAESLREGRWTGVGGRRIRHVVNLGIGGSDLGPRMAYRALRPYAHPEIEILFVSNVDGRDLEAVLEGLDPAETLFIVCSKTFTTQETLTNATAAREWLLQGLGDNSAVAQHFVAVSTNREAVEAFGIRPENMFGFWDWVGGRYSLTSAVGLSVMIAVGSDCFREFLAGAHAMDEHFRRAPIDRNMPVILGMIGVYYRSFGGWPAHCVVPYSEDLKLFPAYLQQLDMESNGKGVDLDGEWLEYSSGPLVFGDAGTNVQHAFFQLFHQGPDPIPCDFLAFSQSHSPYLGHQDILMAHCFAQSEALAFGRTEEAAGEGKDAQAAHRRFTGNRPSNTILAQSLTPATLGALIALYEHRVFVQGVVWGLNSFDQFGVELGKVLASEILKEIQSGRPEPGRHDASTEGLLRRYVRDRASS